MSWTSFFFPVYWSAVFAASEVCAGVFICGWLEERNIDLERLDLILTSFLNPVTTTLLPTILQITIISLESSKKTKLGKEYILELEKVTISEPAWIPCEFPVIKYEKRFIPGFWKQDLGRKLLLNQQCSCWDMSSSQTRRTLDEDKDSLLSFLSESDLNLATGSSFIYIKPSRLVEARITLAKLMTASRGA